MSKTKIRKIREANILLESRFLKKDGEDFDFEEIPSNEPPSDFEDDFEEVTDYGFDTEDDFEGDDFQKDMGFKDFIKRNRPSSVGIGDKVRWDKDSEKEYSPLKPTDVPLEKYLKLKKDNKNF